MERETGIEPATNSLEGCDSTTELLPPSRRLTSLPAASASALSRFCGTSRRGRPAYLPHSSNPSLYPPQVACSTLRRAPRTSPNVPNYRVQRCVTAARSAPVDNAKALSTKKHRRGGLSPPTSARPTFARREKVGGEGRVRTSVARRRQVYSLLRLTALPPPRKLVVCQRTSKIRLRAGALAGVIHEPLS
jgi:hypothetical protein